MIDFFSIEGVMIILAAMWSIGLMWTIIDNYFPEDLDNDH